MSYLFTSESVSEGHPDKVCDQISDALLDSFLSQDPESKVACETLVTTGLVLCAGEVRTTGYVAVDDVARKVIQHIGYDKSDYQFDYKSCAVISTIHNQSSDIHQGVVREKEEEQGAGDQGMMFGYACNETDSFMPITVEVAHMLLETLSEIRREQKEMTYLRPDAKSQVTLQYAEDGTPECIDTIVISTQHDDFDEEEKMLARITEDVKNILIPRVLSRCAPHIQKLFSKDFKLLVNPTGKFVIGGPHGDTGVTGRKIIVDTYGGHGAHGGGAFSGKDPSKVDRSAAYATRHIAKNMVAAGLCDKVLVQVSYAIGRAEPVNLLVNTFQTAKIPMSDNDIATKIMELFDMKPYAINKRFGLKNPIYTPTATYGHFGRDAYEKEVEVFFQDEDTYLKNGKWYKKITFFGWEKLDFVEKIKHRFALK